MQDKHPIQPEKRIHYGNNENAVSEVTFLGDGVFARFPNGEWFYGEMKWVPNRGQVMSWSVPMNYVTQCQCGLISKEEADRLIEKQQVEESGKRRAYAVHQLEMLLGNDLGCHRKSDLAKIVDEEIRPEFWFVD